MVYDTNNELLYVCKAYESISRCYKTFRVENNLLMYLSRLTQPHPVVVVLMSYRTQILEMFHDNAEARHLGEIETYQPIR